MNGVEIEYLLGLYFVIVSLTYSGGRVSADFVRLVGGVLLLVLAVLGKSFIGWGWYNLDRDVFCQEAPKGVFWWIWQINLEDVH